MKKLILTAALMFASCPAFAFVDEHGHYFPSPGGAGILDYGGYDGEIYLMTTYGQMRIVKDGQNAGGSGAGRVWKYCQSIVGMDSSLQDTCVWQQIRNSYGQGPGYTLPVRW